MFVRILFVAFAVAIFVVFFSLFIRFFSSVWGVRFFKSFFGRRFLGNCGFLRCVVICFILSWGWISRLFLDCWRPRNSMRFLQPFPKKLLFWPQVLDTRDYDLNLCKISVFFTAKLTNRMIARLQPFIQSRELEVSYLMLSKFCADRCMWKPRIFLFSVWSNFSPFGNLHGQSLLLKLYL